MRSVFKPLILVAALVAGGMVAVALPAAAAGQQHTYMAGHGGMDKAKMQERMANRTAELKAKLNLTTTAQESAWTNFVAAMQPPADMAQRMSRENRNDMRKEMQAMTTPQRIDRMNEMKAQRDSHMAARNKAILDLYIALTPEQQKVFDDNAMRGRNGMGQHGGKGRHHG